MKALLALLLLPLAACSDAGRPPAAGASPPSAGATPLSAEGSPLRVLEDPPVGPEGDDPPCGQLMPGATCTRVGDVVWTLQADGGSWQLTSFARREGRWTPVLQGSGGGLNPTVSEADLTEAEQPESLVVYGGGFDVVSSQGGDLPAVVVHGEGQASVEDGQVRAGDRFVRFQDGGWSSVPAP